MTETEKIVSVQPVSESQQHRENMTKPLNYTIKYKNTEPSLKLFPLCDVSVHVYFSESRGISHHPSMYGRQQSLFSLEQ